MDETETVISAAQRYRTHKAAKFVTPITVFCGNTDKTRKAAYFVTPTTITGTATKLQLLSHPLPLSARVSTAIQTNMLSKP